MKTRRINLSADAKLKLGADGYIAQGIKSIILKFRPTPSEKLKDGHISTYSYLI